MKVYLCGPITGCTDAECKDWREDAKKHLPDTLDPMRRDYRDTMFVPDVDVVEQDKLDIMTSNAILVNYFKPSVGTSMEILFAWEQGKKVIIVNTQRLVMSPWLVYHSDHIFTSFESAYEELTED